MAFYMLRPAMSYEEALHLGGDRVLTLLGLPALQTLLHIARLRHLLSCIQTSVPIMWGLLHWQASWLASVRTSLEWLWTHVGRDFQAPHWQAAWSQWQDICLSRPGRWKSLLRRAQHQACLQERWRFAARQHLGLLGRQLRLAGATIPATSALSEECSHFCAPCQLIFDSYQAWSVHAFKTHGHTAEHRQVQHGLQCQACLRHFTTHVKLCRHLQYQPRCRQTLLSQGHHCSVEPGVGNKRAVDEGKFQAPSLQAQGPVLPCQADRWVPYLERPSIEVLDCLHFVDFDLDPEHFTETAVKDKARLAFGSVCLPLPKIRATVRAWGEQIPRRFAEAPAQREVCQAVISWILNCDLVQWLVPTPRGKVPALHTFQQAEGILANLDPSSITPPVILCPRDPTLIRVGPADWLRGLPEGPLPAVDFTHEECLEAFRDGRTPCFIEDPPSEVIFILSVRSLPGWSARPSPPVKDRVFSERFDHATLHYDLARFALRLWIAGIPTAFITDCLPESLPTQVQTLPFLTAFPCFVPASICTGNFAWEPFSFHFS